MVVTIDGSDHLRQFRGRSFFLPILASLGRSGRVLATYTDATGQFTYYLLGNNFSVVGTGNADGSSINGLNYSSMGDFAGSGMIPTDLNQDGWVDGEDALHMRSCMAMTSQGPPEPDCQNADLDHDGDVDGEDSARLNVCLAGSFVPVAPECFGPAASGSFTMHGLMVDVLADGKALLYARARHYDMKHGRWLQRDPLGFVDGPNLYEAFGSNPLIYADPYGTDVWDWVAWVLTKLGVDPAMAYARNDSPHRSSPREGMQDTYARIAQARRNMEAEAWESIKHGTGHGPQILRPYVDQADWVVMIPIEEGSETVGYALVPYGEYVEAVREEAKRASMPEHGCLGKDFAEAGFGVAPGGQPFSAVVGLGHAAQHAWYGDETGALVRGGLAIVPVVDDVFKAGRVGYNMIPVIHSVPKKPAGARVIGLFESVATDPKFLRIAGVTEQDMRAALQSASIRYSNVFQGGFAGRVATESGGSELVLGLSRLHARRSPAAHELFHLARDLKGVQSLDLAEMPGLLGRVQEEAYVWTLQFRYAPVATSAETVGNAAVVVGTPIGVKIVISRRR